MRVSFGTICRGQGVAYIQILVHNAEQYNNDNYEVRFSVQSENETALPFSWYNYGKTQYDIDSYVIVTPLLETQSLSIKVEIVNRTDGSVIDSTSRSINRSRIKWTSRLNYKIDKTQARSIRDIDRFAFSNQVHLTPLYVTLSLKKKEIVVKGTVTIPIGSNSTLNLVDAEGTPCDWFKPYILPIHHTKVDGIERQRFGFTARVPYDGKTYCLIASSCEKGIQPAFMCFDEASRNYYFYKYTPNYYRLSEKYQWQHYVEDRERHYVQLDNSDFTMSNGPKFSVIVPLYHTPVTVFKEMIYSVINQTYSNWELILVNSTPNDEDLRKAVNYFVDDRIVIKNLPENIGISGNTNVGIEASTGDYVALFDHDDLLDPLALFRYAQAIVKDPSIDVLYCDEDFLTESGDRIAPHFKSDFNIDLLRCHNYITHFLTIRASYAKELRLRSEFDGAQDYDLVLRLAERTHAFCHIPEVLYHWRMSATSTASGSEAKPYAVEAGLKALKEHFTRIQVDADVQLAEWPCFYRTSYKVQGMPLVSIIIPNKDCSRILDRCITSLFEKTNYKNIEVIIVENNSVEAETFAYYDHIQQVHRNVRVVTWEHEFNYAKINNFGAAFAHGDYFLMLNNDTEVIAPDWLSSMLGFCQREDVGIVGAKLLYPDNTIQHAGVAMTYCSSPGQTGGPIHIFCHLDAEDSGYMNRAAVSQDVQMVTGACLLTKRSVFKQVGGLSEQYAVAFNDVDFCLKVRQAGYLVVYDSDAILYHYESFSRGSDDEGDKAVRFISEQGLLRREWPRCFHDPDPYYGKYF